MLPVLPGELSFQPESPPGLSAGSLGPPIAPADRPQPEYAAPERVPAILRDGGRIETRSRDLEGVLAEHFRLIRQLARYSKQYKQNWFPSAENVNAPSLVLPHIRAAEKTAIAYLAGGKPNWKVSSYGGYAGTAQQDPDRAKRDAKFEKLARAIWHHIDRQSEQPLAYDPVERAIRQGEIIWQFGWIPEAQRLQGDPGYVPQTGEPDDSAADLASHAGASRHRFPVYIRVLNRLKVVYELDPFGEPVEVYHRYRSRCSQVAELFPEWEWSGQYDPFDEVEVVEAYVGAYWAVTVDEKMIFPARRHHYGARPPFVIAQCAPEEVWSNSLSDEGQPETRVGMPFAYDMMNAFREACIGASLNRAIVEYAALGMIVIEHSHESRRNPDANKDGNGQLMVGPGTALFLIDDEKLASPPVAALPPALASYFERAHEGLEILSFSTKLMQGDTGANDSSGYAVEQMRQAAMARLLPFRDAIARGWSRLFEKIFVLLSENWAAEWGNQVTLTGQQEGKFFAETITPEDLSPPPDTVEMTLIPAVPQNRIAEEQMRNSSVQAGTMDVLVAMEERGSPDPQEEYESSIVHKAQTAIPELMLQTAQAIIAKRLQDSNQMPPQGMTAMGNPMMPNPIMGGGGNVPGLPGGPGPGRMMPGGPQPQQPQPMGPRPMSTDPRGMQGPPQRMPPMPRRPGARGPAPQQRPAMKPSGLPGSPNPPIPANTRRRP